uniref:Microtubule-associated protein 6-like n=1 Tax=Scleropages formosus TaxID=113540 RepID=A0A8C9TTU6_SCLFO
MAWPCITRACCINRFWTELDKADIAVPLVFTKYSDATDEPHFHVQPRSKQAPPQGRVAIETQPTQGVSRAAGAEGSTASVMRQDFRAWKVRPERSCKPKNEYQPSEIPFNNETQYQKDFKPWPIPKKRDHPWIPKPSLSARSWRAPPEAGEEGEGAERLSGRADAAVEGRGRAAVDALNRQIKEELGTAYMDVKPVKPIRARSQYNPPVEEKSSLETSYSATFRGEQSRHLSADNKLQEHRRIRSLYSEPGRELSKVEKPSTPKSKPKKTSTPVSSHSKPVKKAKEKQVSSVAGNKKKASEKDPEDINNKLAEAKE